MEQLIIGVILQHPEYHRDLDNPEALSLEYSPEQGRTNPFLHMGLHIALQEQLHTDRPPGIRDIYQRLGTLHPGDNHELEHKMIDCLAEILWSAQTNNTLPDEAVYLECLQKIK